TGPRTAHALRRAPCYQRYRIQPDPGYRHANAPTQRRGQRPEMPCARRSAPRRWHRDDETCYSIQRGAKKLEENERARARGIPGLPDFSRCERAAAASIDSSLPARALAAPVTKCRDPGHDKEKPGDQRQTERPRPGLTIELQRRQISRNHNCQRDQRKTADSAIG